MAHPASYTAIEDVMMNHEIYAEKDVPMHLQDKSHRFCLLSVVGPEGCGQAHKSMAIRIYGCKAAKQQANGWARKIPAKSGNFDVLNVSTNNWIALPPRLEGDQDDRCVEERVDAIFELYKQEELDNKEKLKRQLDKETRVEPPLKQKPEGVELVFTDDDGNVLDNKDVDDDDNGDEVAGEVSDDVKDKAQKWTVLSVVAPEFPEDARREMAVRIHGCRDREEDAKAWASQLRESNPYFHVFVMENNQWAALPPDVSKISEINTTDKNIQKIHDSFRLEEIERRKDQAKELDAMHQKEKPVKITEKEE